MIDPESMDQLRDAIRSQVANDSILLDRLRREIRPLRSATRRIQPRGTTSISLVGTDGGNNQLQFDPFLVQLVRVVDSSNNEYCLEAVSPTTSVTALSGRQFNQDGSPRTALGKMMSYLGVASLVQLSSMIRAVKFWRERRLFPPKADVLEIIRRRAHRFYGEEKSVAHGNMTMGDSQLESSFARIQTTPAWILTSPPYYGMRTYIPDQWLRNWFLGGPETVDYSNKGQLTHLSKEEFARTQKSLDKLRHGRKTRLPPHHPFRSDQRSED